MGDIIRPGARADAAFGRSRSAPRRSSASTCCTARGWRRRCDRTRAADLGRRVRVLWQGAEYRGRGRETMWQGKLTVDRKSHRAVRAGELPQSRAQGARDGAGAALAWTSVTTGNLAGIDLWLDRGAARHAQHRDQHRVGRRSISRRLPTTRSRSTAAGLAGSSASIVCPRADWSRRVTLDHTVTFPGGADLPVYLRVTQADGSVQGFRSCRQCDGAARDSCPIGKDRLRSGRGRQASAGGPNPASMPGPHGRNHGGDRRSGARRETPTLRILSGEFEISGAVAL